MSKETASENAAAVPLSESPSGLRDKLWKELPRYSGEYSVGTMEIEYPVDEPQTFSHITRNKRHVLELETVLFTIYYPSAFGAGSGNDPSGRKKWSRATWMPRPRRKMAQGYARFAGVPSLILEPYLLGTVGITKTRAFRNARLAKHWPPPGNAAVRGYSVKNSSGGAPEDEPEQPVFPLLIFSHGLGGNRSTYSSLMGEFASYGFVVVAVEHRDGSGVRTFVNHPSPKWRQNNNVDHTEKELNKNYDRVDYIWPLDNPADTAPHNEKGVDQELRRAQIDMRKAEIKEIERVLRMINDGDGHLVAAKNLRKRGNIGSSTRGLEGVVWSEWQGRIHLDMVTMLGHSFGAATAVSILRDRAAFPNMRQGIIYDIWGGPINFDDQQKIQTPLLGINSEAFMYWEQNLRIATRITKEAMSEGALAWLMTVRGTVHITQSDFHILFPHLTRALLGATADAKRALRINVNASLEFLRIVMPDRVSQLNHGSDEGLLQTTVLQRMPTEHKPKTKWIALRLASNTPRDLTRGLTNRARKRGNDASETGAAGEIWMHIAPTEQELKYKGIKGLVAPKNVSQPETGDAADQLIGKDMQENMDQQAETTSRQS